VPEGQVSHRNAGRFTRALAGRPVLRAWTDEPRVLPQRIPERLAGDTVEGAEARGKHHLLRFASGRVLHSHLMMSGVWRLVPDGRPVRPGGLYLAIQVPGATAALYRCPQVRLLEPGEPLPAAVRRLGPDLLDEHTDPGADTAARLAATEPTRQVGDAVMDQRIVSGIGNVYKSETLFLAGVDPWRAVGSLTPPEAVRIGEIAAGLLAKGVRERGSISTYDPPGRPPGAAPSGAKWVYGRRGRPCRRCGTPIRSRGQGDANRTTYWCPRCQG
jgi:endonuclease-8